MAEEFDGRGEVFGRHAVEAAVRGEESIGGEDMQVGMEEEVVPEGVDGSDSAEFSIGEVEAEAEVVAEALAGSAEENGEEVAAFAEDAAQDLGDGEDELAVGDFVADGGGDPLARGTGAALVAGGAEVAGLAGEGEEAFVAAVRALKSGESAGEVTAAEKGLDGGRGVGAEWAEGLPVAVFVTSEELVPAVVDDLPEGRGAGAARLVDGRHNICS